MKKILLLMITIISLALIIPVNAASAWPKSFTEGDYTYSIEGIVLNVYEVSRSANDSEYTVQKKRTIDLSADDYTINPISKRTMINSINSLLININLNFTNEKFEQLLQNEINEANENKNYIVDMAVKYKFTNYPDKYKEIYSVDINHQEEVSSIELPPREFGKGKFKKLNTSETNEQVIEQFSIPKIETNCSSGNNDTNCIERADGEQQPAPQLLDYESFYENTRTSDNDTPSFVIAFHNNEKIDKMYETISGDPTSSAQMVKVEDTASNYPIVIYIVSVILLLLGSLVLVYSVEKQKNNQNI